MNDVPELIAFAIAATGLDEVPPDAIDALTAFPFLTLYFVRTLFRAWLQVMAA